MDKKILLVVKREYFKIVKKPTFWITTLFFPVFILVVGFISGYSSEVASRQADESIAGSKSILVLDKTESIGGEDLYDPYRRVDDLDEGVELVKENQVQALFYYPENLNEGGEIKIYAQSQGIFNNFSYNSAAQDLLKNSIINDLGDQRLIELYNKSYSFETEIYEDGSEVESGVARLAIPILGVIIYFVLTSFGTSYMLMSVSEEKENRMIEIVLTLIKPRSLMVGKITGLLFVVVTQLLILVSFAVVGLTVLRDNVELPVDIGSLSLDPVQIFQMIFYVLVGFIFLANVMVGVGAIAPSYKEAQSMSSVFIIFSILPIYFFSIILSDPNGLVAQITSYFPFTAAMILLLRSAIGELSVMETIISSSVLILYAVISFWIAIKFFEIGALQYNRKLSVKEVLGVFKRK